MTLHQTIDAAKKFLLGIGVSIGVIIVFALLFQVGVIIKNILVPPKIEPENHLYDQLPALQFPQNATDAKLTYTLNTITGTLPEFPSRLNVFPIQQPEPNFLNLEKAKDKAERLGFTTDDGKVLPEINHGQGNYEWSKTDTSRKKLAMSIITFNFNFTSDYLSSQNVIDARNLRDEITAVNIVQNFLTHIEIPTTDIDFDKTKTPNKETPYTTTPQLFSITNGELIPTTSLSKTQVMRVDLYQKNIMYSLNTGIAEVTGGIKKEEIDLPILYPNPPYSTMNFLVASGDFEAQVVGANFTHQLIAQSDETEATYLIKTGEEAFEELKNGKAYIAAYSGSKLSVNITKVYLAYYLGQNPQKYLMPIIVFEGDDGFFAYVSAVKDEWIK